MVWNQEIYSSNQIELRNSVTFKRKCMYFHRGMIEEEIQLLFFWAIFNSFLFELFFLCVYWWFPNGLKSKHVSDFVINCFWNCQESEGSIINLGTIFLFSSFLNFWKFRNRFSYQLKQIFPINYMFLELRHFFVKVFRRYKTEL